MRNNTRKEGGVQERQKTQTVWAESDEMVFVKTSEDPETA
jgi:hypothetical protein